MRLLRKKLHPSLLCLIVASAFIVSPVLDSMACDDFSRSSPSPGSGIEIRCGHAPTASTSDAASDNGSESDVHVFCPLCYSLTGVSDSPAIGRPILARILSVKPVFVSLALVASPIYKPPQNNH